MLFRCSPSFRSDPLMNWDYGTKLTNAKFVNGEDYTDNIQWNTLLWYSIYHIFWYMLPTYDFYAFVNLNTHRCPFVFIIFWEPKERMRYGCTQNLKICPLSAHMMCCPNWLMGFVMCFLLITWLARRIATLITNLLCVFIRNIDPFSNFVSD